MQQSVNNLCALRGTSYLQTLHYDAACARQQTSRTLWVRVGVGGLYTAAAPVSRARMEFCVTVKASSCWRRPLGAAACLLQHAPSSLPRRAPAWEHNESWIHCASNRPRATFRAVETTPKATMAIMVPAYAAAKGREQAITRCQLHTSSGKVTSCRRAARQKRMIAQPAASCICASESLHEAVHSCMHPHCCAHLVSW